MPRALSPQTQKVAGDVEMMECAPVVGDFVKNPIIMKRQQVELMMMRWKMIIWPGSFYIPSNLSHKMEEFLM